MATYKVLQDIEAEDKFLGPLTLRQFIYAGITVVCLYLSFIALSKHMALFLAVLLPPAAAGGVLAWPWSGQQTTEVWLLAKIRFWLKPRLRKWDQSGIKELVTITVPKRDKKIYTNGLDQTEVKSRLQALAQTIDSRGWAIKNVNVNLYDQAAYQASQDNSDRLVNLANLPQEVSGLDILAGDDILDEHSNPIAMHFEQMIKTTGQEKRQGILERMRKIREGQESYDEANATDGASDEPWFLPATPATAPAAPSQPAEPDLTAADEQQLLEKLHEQEEQMDEALGQSPEKVESSEPRVAGNTQDSKSEPAAQTSYEEAAPAILKPIVPMVSNDDGVVAKIPHDDTASQPSAPQPESDEADNEVVISLR